MLKKIVGLFQRKKALKDQYEVKLQQSDFNGDVFDPIDCRGSRALARAAGFEVLWGVWEGFIITGKKREKETCYESYDKEGKVIGMIHDVKVGDTVIFKKYKP